MGVIALWHALVEAVRAAIALDKRTSAPGSGAETVWLSLRRRPAPGDVLLGSPWSTANEHAPGRRSRWRHRSCQRGSSHDLADPVSRIYTINML
jgi:hypothetical protein